MDKMKVTVVLENNEVLTLRQKDRDGNLVMLTDGYALTGGYTLYKREGNVICGTVVPYKRLDIHIKNK